VLVVEYIYMCDRRKIYDPRGGNVRREKILRGQYFGKKKRHQ